jgi:hypothetical protein
VDYILGLDDSKIIHTTSEKGESFEGELAIVYVPPGETLETLDFNALLFDLKDEVYNNVPMNTYSWFDQIRIELGRQIRERSREGKPIVIEAGFGTNTDKKGENPMSHSIHDLFTLLEVAKLDPNLVKWIIIEASYQVRLMRNQKRKDTVPAKEFDRFAASGGDLTPAEEQEWVKGGARFIRVPNNHDDYQRFKKDIIAAYKELFENG